MWERTLQDLIRGLRANKKDESKFIAKAVEEIRNEIKSDDMELKAGAVLKLTYLDMMGYDMSWASFHVVEVMSSPRLHLKSVGYLAATQSFEEDTDVLMLTTNLLKKDLSSTPADIAITLNGLSHIITQDLARDLSPELIGMLNHSRPHIRKRAVAVLFKVIVNYPGVPELARTRLEEKLDDPDPGVVAATVNVLCELARRNPQNYLTLAPRLFHLLTTSSNNWMLIKIIKLFGSLSPHEPRLVKKLQPPITELISTTSAISLLYECVHTCIIGGMLQGPSGDSLAKMCVSKLAGFIQDPDQNLKYIALLAMVKIIPTHSYLIAEYQDTILTSISDPDISIRMRALDLVSAMVNRDNLQSIVQQILTHLVSESSSTLPNAAQSLALHATPTSPTSARPPAPSPTQSPAYRLVLAQRILNMCSQSTYDNVTNFEWYISVLVDLAHVANVNVGAEIRDQLVDIVGRVRAVRRYAVRLMYTLITDGTMLRNSEDEGSCAEVLWAAAWICGEYCDELAEPQKLLPYILQPEISKLSPDIVAVHIQAAAKIYGSWAAELAQRWHDDNLQEVKDAVDLVLTRLADFALSPDTEVQERAATTLQLFRFIQADLGAFRPRTGPSVASSSFDVQDSEPRYPKSLYLIQPLNSAYELNPVAANAQSMVPVPEGLDLDAWIIPPPREPPPAQDIEKAKTKKKSKKGKGKETNGGTVKSKKKVKVDDDVLLQPHETETPEEIAERAKRKAERLAQLKDDPYYITDEPPKAVDVESVPVVHLEGMPPLLPAAVDARLPTLKASLQSFPPGHFIVEKRGEMPEGVVVPLRPGSTPASVVSEGMRQTPHRISSYPNIKESEDGLRPSTPDTIKVTRAKRKGTGKKKWAETPPSAAET